MAVGRVGLNLALVIDVSGSMYEEDGTGISRLKRVQDAMKEAVAQLKPEDTVSIVAFAHNAQTVLESVKVAEKEKIESTIDSIDMFDVDPGGTSMNEGIEHGMKAVEKAMGNGKLTQIVVLTDGETSGEQMCRKLAKEAGEKKMHLTLMGVGTEWNAGAHQGPRQDLRRQVVLHRRQRQGIRRQGLRRGVLQPGGGRLHGRGDAPAAREGREHQARSHGRSGDQGDQVARSRKSGTWSRRWARSNATTRASTSSTSSCPSVRTAST